MRGTLAGCSTSPVNSLKKIVEHLVISGAARFDLMAKVMDLGNELGGLIFDISLPTKTGH